MGNSPVTPAAIDRYTQQIRGNAATWLRRQYYSVYRAQPDTSGNLLASPPIISAFAAYGERAKKTDLEDETFELVALAMTCNIMALQFGDILVGQPSSTDGSILCFAQFRPQHPAIFMRCETLVTVRRPDDPNTDAAESEAAPTAGPIEVDGWEETAPANGAMLTLANGVYSFSPAAQNPQPTIIPIGIQPTSRASQQHSEDLPSSTMLERFTAYAPPLNGLAPPLRENDEFIDPVAQATYTVIEVSNSQNAGIAGSIMLLTKEGA